MWGGKRARRICQAPQACDSVPAHRPRVALQPYHYGPADPEGDAVKTSTLFRRVVVISLLATVLLCVVPAAASAASLAGKKAQARAAAAQVAALDQRLNGTVALCVAAAQRLEALQTQVASNRATLRLARYQLVLARQELADHLVLAYKSGNADVLNAVFQAGSFTDLLTRLDYVQHVTGSDAGLLRAVEGRQREAAAAQVALQAGLGRAQQTTADLAAQRSTLLAELSSRRAVLHGLNATVARLVAQTRAVTPVAAVQSTATPPSTAGDGTGPWWPQIRAAAAADGVWAEGLYRLMNAESQGSATASNGVDFGLYQYAAGTWKGSWNPWRSASIFDGGAQIKATALAISQGHGPAWWPTTYAWAFSRQ
jgi:peptidoglycan hydrolase CwlO-like protein